MLNVGSCRGHRKCRATGETSREYLQAIENTKILSGIDDCPTDVFLIRLTECADPARDAGLHRPGGFRIDHVFVNIFRRGWKFQAFQRVGNSKPRIMLTFR